MDIFKVFLGKKRQFEKVSVSELNEDDVFVFSRKDEKMNIVTKIQVTQIKYEVLGSLEKGTARKKKKVYRLVELEFSLLSGLRENDFFCIEPRGDVFQALAFFVSGVAVKNWNTGNVSWKENDQLVLTESPKEI